MGELGDDVLPLTMGAERTDPGSIRGAAKAYSTLTGRLGLPTPAFFIIDSPEENAFASGFTPYASSVTLTTALVDRLDEDEIVAVVAHEFGHIANGDVADRTSLAYRWAVGRSVIMATSVAAGILALATDSFGLGLLTLGLGTAANNAARRRAEAALSKQCHLAEFSADAYAIRLGYGPMLASALQKMTDSPPPPPGRALPPWSRVLLVTDTKTASFTHPAVADRLGYIPPVSISDPSFRTCPFCTSAYTVGQPNCPVCLQPTPHTTCASCQAVGATDDRYCSQCGDPMPERACRCCGQPDSGRPWCVRCGHSLP